MTSKELMYIEDALAHEKFLAQQCKAASSQMSDKELASYVSKLESKHTKIYDQLYGLV